MAPPVAGPSFMARPRLELGTPRFSGIYPTGASSARFWPGLNIARYGLIPAFNARARLPTRMARDGVVAMTRLGRGCGGGETVDAVSAPPQLP
jgi:hypothetical protein